MKKQSEPGYGVAATLTIHKAADMTPKGRRAIAGWLRIQADQLVADGKEYGARFTARYWFKEPKR